MDRIVQNIERPPRDLVEALSRFGSATVHEALGRIGAVSPALKPIRAGMRLCGPAVTAQLHPGDNLMLSVAISLAHPGDVLAVAADGTSTYGYFGDLLATACASRRLGGLLISGGARDADAIAAMGFPVFSCGLGIRGTTKENPGYVNHHVMLGGVAVEPGDVIVGDGDGVVVVPRDRLAEAVEQSIAREEKEAGLRAQLASGADPIDVFHYREILRQKGLLK